MQKDTNFTVYLRFQNHQRMVTLLTDVSEINAEKILQTLTKNYEGYFWKRDIFLGSMEDIASMQEDILNIFKRISVQLI